MKLWREVYPGGGGNDEEVNSEDSYGADCNGQCNLSITLRDPLAIKSCMSASDILTQQFQLIAPCWIHSCASDRWIVCNPTGTGQIIVVDEEIKQLLDIFRSPHTLNDIYEDTGEGRREQLQRVVSILLELGFLWPADEALPPFIQQSSDQLTAWMHITNACNLRCDYCYIRKTSEHMSQDIALAAVDALFRSAQLEGYKRIVLKYAGGEASLQLKSLLVVHDYALKKAEETGIAIHGVILTNGVMMTPRMIEQFQARAFSITISLDGIGAAHDVQRPFLNGRGSFTYIDRSIKRLLAHQIRPHISVTITRQNLPGLPELVSYIMENDLTFSLHFYRDNDYAVGPEGMAYEEQEMIGGMRRVYALIEEKLPPRSLVSSLIDLAQLQAPHEHTCGVGNNYLAITHKGGIAKCHMTLQDPLTTVAATNPLRVIQNDARGLQNLSVNEREGCRDCLWRYWCGGGCPLLTYRMTGRYDIKSPNCHIYQALFPDVLRLEALRLLRYTTPVDLENSDPFYAKCLRGDSVNTDDQYSPMLP